MKKGFDIVINEERVKRKKMFVVHCLNLGITSQGMTIEEAVDKVRGPEGSTAKLHIRRNADTFDVSVVRAVVAVPGRES